MEQLIEQVNLAGVQSFMTQRSRQRFLNFNIPVHVFVGSYIGNPRTGSFSSLAQMGFLNLRTEGPNNGLSLLSDLIAPGGLILAEMGRDQFLLDEGIDVATVALAMTVIQQLENPEPRSFSNSVKEPQLKVP